jgi:predicted dithiol-disulfide oxidoreductase (DUF899 family)
MVRSVRDKRRRQANGKEIGMQLPEVVSASEWEAAQKQLRAKEKELTRRSDELSAERRRLPRTMVEKDYEFEGPRGTVGLPDLFEGRRQLVLYHFMFGPNQDAGCGGCSMFIDQVGHPAHLHARDVTFAITSRAPFAKLERFRRQLGWEHPWYSWGDGDFGVDFGTSPAEPKEAAHQDGEGFALSVLLRDGGDVYRTYVTRSRGVEAIGPVWSFLDRAPFGRQETWEDSPAGYPQSEPYTWWRYHDDYEEAR